jgi:hypothetical protein
MDPAAALPATLLCRRCTGDALPWEILPEVGWAHQLHKPRHLGHQVLRVRGAGAAGITHVLPNPPRRISMPSTLGCTRCQCRWAAALRLAPRGMDAPDLTPAACWEGRAGWAGGAALVRAESSGGERLWSVVRGAAYIQCGGHTSDLCPPLGQRVLAHPADQESSFVYPYTCACTANVPHSLQGGHDCPRPVAQTRR